MKVSIQPSIIRSTRRLCQSAHAQEWRTESPASIGIFLYCGEQVACDQRTERSKTRRTSLHTTDCSRVCTNAMHPAASVSEPTGTEVPLDLA